MFTAAVPMYDAHLRAIGPEWISLPAFVATRLQPNQFVVARRFRHVAETLS
jgi:hypothetical protein